MTGDNTYVTGMIRRCSDCHSAIGSIAFEQNPDPSREEFRDIQAAFGEVALTTYLKLESDSQSITQEGIENLVSALLHLSDIMEYDKFKMITNAFGNYFDDRR